MHTSENVISYKSQQRTLKNTPKHFTNVEGVDQCPLDNPADWKQEYMNVLRYEGTHSAIMCQKYVMCVMY